jgi:hypothetical protein
MQTSQAHAELEDKTHQVNFVSMLDALSYTIDRISCEVRQYISILML